MVGPFDTAPEVLGEGRRPVENREPSRRRLPDTQEFVEPVASEVPLPEDGTVPVQADGLQVSLEVIPGEDVLTLCNYENAALRGREARVVLDSARVIARCLPEPGAGLAESGDLFLPRRDVATVLSEE